MCISRKLLRFNRMTVPLLNVVSRWLVDVIVFEVIVSELLSFTDDDWMTLNVLPSSLFTPITMIRFVDGLSGLSAR